MKSSTEKIVEIDGIGPVTFKRTRGKYYKVSIKRNQIICTYPWYGSFKTSLQFLDEKKSWIKKQLEHPSIKKLPPIDLTNGFQTKTSKIILSPEICDEIKIDKQQKQVIIHYSGQENIKEQKMQNIIITTIENIWKQEAKIFLIDRIQELARQFGFQVNKVSTRRTRSRWGSCSPENNISLSLYIMNLRQELIDMVILHELSHTKVKNHGPRFRSLLQKICPNVKELEKEIRQHSVYPF